MLSYEFLERALRIIEKPENWCQHIMENGEGSVCAAGAINRALSGDAFCYSTPDTELLTSAMRGINAIEVVANHHGYRRTPRKSAIAVLNNATDHPTVVGAFQEAIRNEKVRLGVPIEVPAEEQELAHA